MPPSAPEVDCESHFGIQNVEQNTKTENLIVKKKWGAKKVSGMGGPRGPVWGGRRSATKQNTTQDYGKSALSALEVERTLCDPQ